MASVQLNSRHICTSGIIFEDLLITAAQCTCYIEEKMAKSQHGSAVLGHVDLNKGDRYDIQDVKHHENYSCKNMGIRRNKEKMHYDVGIILVG